MGLRNVIIQAEVEVDMFDAIDDLDKDEIREVIKYCDSLLRDEPAGDSDLFWQAIHQACLTNDMAKVQELLRERLWTEIGRTF